MSKKNDNTVTLDTPIKRGGEDITSIELRKPGSGELRGLKLTDLLDMDVTALHRVLPRISTPILTESEVSSMDPADLLSCASKVAGFLLPKATMQAVSQKE